MYKISKFYLLFKFIFFLKYDAEDCLNPLMPTYIIPPLTSTPSLSVYLE